MTLAELGQVLGAPEASLAGFILVMLASLSLLFFTMFVAAPRAVAGVGGGGRTWVARFVLFLASLLLGVSWLRFVV